MSQGPIAVALNAVKRTFAQLASQAGGVATPAQLDPSGALVTASGGVSSALYVSGTHVIKASPGRVIRVNVLVAGAAGTINDCATTAAVATANEVAVIPATVGPIDLEFPCLTGITVAPGAAQVISVSYQ